MYPRTNFRKKIPDRFSGQLAGQHPLFIAAQLREKDFNLQLQPDAVQRMRPEERPRRSAAAWLAGGALTKRFRGQLVFGGLHLTHCALFSHGDSFP